MDITKIKDGIAIYNGEYFYATKINSKEIDIQCADNKYRDSFRYDRGMERYCKIVNFKEVDLFIATETKIVLDNKEYELYLNRRNKDNMAQIRLEPQYVSIFEKNNLHYKPEVINNYYKSGYYRASIPLTDANIIFRKYDFLNDLFKEFKLNMKDKNSIDFLYGGWEERTEFIKQLDTESYKELKMSCFSSLTVGVINNKYCVAVPMGFCDVLEYYPITKDEFETFNVWQEDMKKIYEIEKRESLK